MNSNLNFCGAGTGIYFDFGRSMAHQKCDYDRIQIARELLAGACGHTKEWHWLTDPPSFHRACSLVNEVQSPTVECVPFAENTRRCLAFDCTLMFFGTRWRSSCLADNGNDLASLAKILGHASLKTTSRYSRRGEEQLGAALERLSY